MRSPDRIKKIIELFEKVWSEHPDHRFGQLLVNLLRFPSEGRKCNHCQGKGLQLGVLRGVISKTKCLRCLGSGQIFVENDPWNVEDDDLLRRLENHINGGFEWALREQQALDGQQTQ